MRQALFSYKKADTPLHRLPALAKLVAQVVLCIALFLKPQPVAAEAVIQVACGGIIAIAFVVAKLSIFELKRLKLIFMLGVLYALFRVFTIAPLTIRSSEIPGALSYIYRFFMSTLSALIFFETTSSLQIKTAFETLQEAFAKIFPPLRRLNPALAVALAINFIPQVFSTWERISRAANARKPKGKRTGFFIGSIYAKLLALLSCLISYAETTRRALANRTAAD